MTGPAAIAGSFLTGVGIVIGGVAEIR